MVLTSIPGELAAPWMAGILLTLGAYVLARFTFKDFTLRPGRKYVRRRYLAPLGLAAGFIDATGGGGWGPVATPTLLATGRMHPRKVIGSVDSSEFIVALAASVGFLLTLGRQGILWGYVGALLAGGLVAAPIAAWLVRKVTPRLLGASVGGLIVMTNARTLMSTFQIEPASRRLVYIALMIVWVGSVAFATTQHRRVEPAGAGG